METRVKIIRKRKLITCKVLSVNSTTGIITLRWREIIYYRYIDDTIPTK